MPMADSHIDNSELLRHLMDHTADHIYFKDLDSRFICINRAQADWMKLSGPESAIGRSDFDFFSEEHARQAFEDEQRIMATDQPVLAKEEKETWPDGRVTWVSTTKMPLRALDGRLLGTFGISRDITAQRLAQEEAARYAARLREVHRQLRDDLAMARELQEAFLPRRYPCFPAAAAPADSALRFHHHYASADLVGGDFFSLHAFSDTEAGVFICDVMGHGVRAALITAIVRTLVGEWVHIERDPGRLLAKLNSLLTPLIKQEELLVFATAFFLTVDVATGRVRFATAGHPPPVWVRRRLGQAVALTPPGLPIGPVLALAPDSLYATGEAQLEAGDRLLLYTDGLIEIENGLREEYGVARLQAAAAAHGAEPLEEFFVRLRENIRAFAEGNPFDDDICLVGVDVQRLGDTPGSGGVT